MGMGIALNGALWGQQEGLAFTMRPESQPSNHVN
ncbi:hypothetical protein RAZWK3B_03260 [Roseobacter sp. AzwK-3b]|nr:hypothetical protein RAZWK3B_03260 [Roseobacter sp. AzwK-3b]